VTAATDAYNAAAWDLAAALEAAINDPADAVRLLLPLTAWMPPPIAGEGSLAASARRHVDALAAGLRAAACGALATATQAYRPASYEDARALRALVCDALDAEATRAADAGRQATYAALRELRGAVALDLAARGANLAWLVEVSTRAPMPSLAEAWALYQDPAREPSLVAAAAVRHPLFLPTAFVALTR
jgi:prophage DNA circulation protein